VEQKPLWSGILGNNSPNAEMFTKIREGQIWRLFSPCVMHRDFLHILFNMIWVLILGKQLEQRLRPWRYVALMLIIGVLSNIAQYLISGPLFLGYSGIVVGMAGFIWVRQKIAPWEGYPLQKSTLIFLLLFVIAMFALEVGSFVLEHLHVLNLSANIANTAHIAGGIIGIILGYIPFLARSGK
jgi:GlpG protein